MALTDIAKPSTLNLCLVRGGSFARTITLMQDGAAVDLSGYSAEAAIFDSAPEQIGSFTAVVDVPATDGQVTLTLDVAGVAALPLRSRWWLKLSLDANPDDNTHIVIVGSVTVNDPASGDDCC